MKITVNPDLASFIESITKNNGIDTEKYVNNLIEMGLMTDLKSQDYSQEQIVDMFVHHRKQAQIGKPQFDKENNQFTVEAEDGKSLSLSLDDGEIHYIQYVTDTEYVEDNIYPTDENYPEYFDHFLDFAIDQIPWSKDCCVVFKNGTVYDNLHKQLLANCTCTDKHMRNNSVCRYCDAHKYMP